MRNYFLRAPPCEAQPQPTPLGAAPQKAAGPRHGPMEPPAGLPGAARGEGRLRCGVAARGWVLGAGG